MKIFEIYDSKAEAYLTPFFSPTTSTAMRSFAQAVNDESSDFHRWAADYTLFYVGEWEPQTGDITTPEAKHSLACAIEFLNQGNGSSTDPMPLAPVRSE